MAAETLGCDQSATSIKPSDRFLSQLMAVVCQRGSQLVAFAGSFASEAEEDTAASSTVPASSVCAATCDSDGPLAELQSGRNGSCSLNSSTTTSSSPHEQLAAVAAMLVKETGSNSKSSKAGADATTVEDRSQTLPCQEAAVDQPAAEATDALPPIRERRTRHSQRLQSLQDPLLKQQSAQQALEGRKSALSRPDWQAQAAAIASVSAPVSRSRSRSPQKLGKVQVRSPGSGPQPAQAGELGKQLAIKQRRPSKELSKQSQMQEGGRFLTGPANSPNQNATNLNSNEKLSSLPEVVAKTAEQKDPNNVHVAAVQDAALVPSAAKLVKAADYESIVGQTVAQIAWQRTDAAAARALQDAQKAAEGLRELEAQRQKHEAHNRKISALRCNLQECAISGTWRQFHVAR